MLKRIMRNIEKGYTDYEDWSEDYQSIIHNIDAHKNKLKLWKYAQEQATKKMPIKKFHFDWQRIKCFFGFHIWDEGLDTRTCIACGRMEYRFPQPPDGIYGEWKEL